MKKKIAQLIVVIGLVTLASTFFLPSTAHAAHASGGGAIQLVNCGNRNDFLKLWIRGEQPECYAYSGEIVANLGEVTQYCTGNNEVGLTWHDSRNIQYVTTAPKWQCQTGIMYVTQVTIY